MDQRHQRDAIGLLAQCDAPRAKRETLAAHARATQHPTTTATMTTRLVTTVTQSATKIEPFAENLFPANPNNQTACMRQSLVGASAATAFHAASMSNACAVALCPSEVDESRRFRALALNSCDSNSLLFRLSCGENCKESPEFEPQLLERRRVARASGGLPPLRHCAEYITSK